MDRSIEQINRDFIRLSEAGLLCDKAKQKEKGNYKIRYGITKKPCFKKIDCTKIMPPLHFWICALRHMEELAFILNTPLNKFKNKKRVMRKGQRKGKVAKDAIKNAKLKLIKKARTTLGLLLASPNSGGNGGSTGKKHAFRKYDYYLVHSKIYLLVWWKKYHIKYYLS